MNEKHGWYKVGHCYFLYLNNVRFGFFNCSDGIRDDLNINVHPVLFTGPFDLESMYEILYTDGTVSSFPARFWRESLLNRNRSISDIYYHTLSPFQETFYCYNSWNLANAEINNFQVQKEKLWLELL